MPIPLTNDRWGYASSCFVCEPTNDGGLQVPFQLDDDGVTVSAEFTMAAEHSGAPTLVHGGLSMALLDEAQAWAVIAVLKKWGLTRSTQATFDGAVFIEQPHVVRATITLDGDAEVQTQAVIVDGSGRELVHSQSVFTVVGNVDEDQAALGLSEKHRRLLRDS